jgi:hypothetical protein
MTIFSRRSLLSAFGLALPFGLGARAGSAATSIGPAPVLRFRPFEEAVRAAFAGCGPASGPGTRDDSAGHGRMPPCRQIEVGHSELIRAGVQGCYNDRPFAGFPAGHLKIVRAGSEPGPVRRGVRLYVSTVDVVLTGGPAPGGPGRPLDFASLPPAPSFVPS